MGKINFTAKRTVLNHLGFISLRLIAITVLVIAAIAFAGYEVQQKNQPASKVVKASNRPGIVTNEQFSASLDSQGAAEKPTDHFKKSDSKVYAVVSLKDAKAGSTIQYVRYYNGSNIGAGSVKIEKDGAKNVSFLFATKPGKERHAGTYRVKVYSNNRAEMSASYTVR